MLPRQARFKSGNVERKGVSCRAPPRGRAESSASDFARIILGEQGGDDGDWLQQGSLQVSITI
eukprot:COSAG06_NODE_20995_length_773_cov_154.709199_1_plen_62_part_10